MASIPTVKVVAASERGWRLINEADFDPKVHRLYGEKPAAQPEPEPEKRSPGRPRKAN